MGSCEGQRCQVVYSMFKTIEVRKKSLSNIIVIILFTLVLSGCRTAPIYNARDIPISPRPSATDEEIEKAIWLAGRRLEWRINKVRPREMQGLFRKQAHTATVLIPYDKTQFSIIYVDSENLDYDGSKIHENYNVWIQRLVDQIQNEIDFRLP